MTFWSHTIYFMRRTDQTRAPTVHVQTNNPWIVLMSVHVSLQWRHNERDSVSNHRRLDCLLNRLFRRKIKKTSKRRVTGLCEGNPPVTGEFPHKGPVTRKMFPFDDVIVFIYSTPPTANLPTVWCILFIESVFQQYTFQHVNVWKICECESLETLISSCILPGFHVKQTNPFYKV